MKNIIRFDNHFNVKHFRGSKQIGEYNFKNGVTNVGLNDLLNSGFGDGTQRTEWYLGLIDDGPTLAATDTMASHAGWTEADDYDEATRQVWLGSEVAASQSLVNASYVEFTIDTTIIIAGLFVCSDSVKNAADGILWATGAFEEGDVSLVSADTLKITYTINMAAG